MIKKCDNRNNLIYIEFISGYKLWREFDENNNLVYWKNSYGDENWWKYDKNNKRILITEKEYKEIEFRKKEKEYNSRTKCSRFELMDI